MRYIWHQHCYNSVDDDEVLRHKPEEDLSSRREKIVVCKQEMALSVCVCVWASVVQGTVF